MFEDFAPSGKEGGRRVVDKYGISLEPFAIQNFVMEIYPPVKDAVIIFPGKYISSFKNQRANRIFSSNISVDIGFKNSYNVLVSIDGNNEHDTLPVHEIFYLRSIVNFVVVGHKKEYVMQTGYISSVGFDVSYDGQTELKLSINALDNIFNEHAIFVTTQRQSSLIQTRTNLSNRAIFGTNLERTTTNNGGSHYFHGDGKNIKSLISNIKTDVFAFEDEQAGYTIIYGGKYSLISKTELENASSFMELLSPVVFKARSLNPTIGGKKLDFINYLEAQLKPSMGNSISLGSDLTYRQNLLAIPIKFITQFYYEPCFSRKEKDLFNNLLLSNAEQEYISNNSLILSAMPYDLWFKVVEGKPSYYRWKTQHEFDSEKIPYFFIDFPSQFSVEYDSESFYTLITAEENTVTSGVVGNESINASSKDHQDTVKLFGSKTYIYEIVNKKSFYKEVLDSVEKMLFPSLETFKYSKSGKGTVVIPFSPVKVNYPLFLRIPSGDYIVGVITGIVDSINADGQATTSIDFDTVELDKMLPFDMANVKTTTTNAPDEPAAPAVPPAPVAKKKGATPKSKPKVPIKNVVATLNRTGRWAKFKTKVPPPTPAPTTTPTVPSETPRPFRPFPNDVPYTY